MKKSEALRQAKLSYIQNADVNKQQPFFWGAFVVIGDDSPIVKQNNFAVKLISFCIVFSLFFGILILIEGRQKNS